MWNSRKTQPPLKLCHFAAHAGVWSAKKKCVYQALSLSLSLSRERERASERRGGRVRVRVGWPGPTPAYPIGPMHTNHPWRPTAPGPLYRLDTCQPPWPALSGGCVPTILAYPIGQPRAGRPNLAYPISPTRTVWACIGRCAPCLQRSSSVPS